MRITFIATGLVPVFGVMNGEEAVNGNTAENVEDNGDTHGEVQKKERVPLNCMKAFDSIYYCYSPVHQAREYYITGQLDDCRGRLRRFRLCVMSRFRPQSVSEQLYAEDDLSEKKKKGLADIEPVWSLKEEYLENVRKAEEEDRRKAELQREGESNGEVKWWL